MIVPTTCPEVNEIMAESLRQRVLIIAETQMHVAPWLHADEGWQDSRLKWAVEAVCAGQVRDTGLAYEVQGDTNVYTIPKAALHRCPCPAAHYGNSQHCKHRVALELSLRVRQAYPEEQPLPLPPTTPDERLAAPAQEALGGPMPVDEAPYIPEPEDAPVAGGGTLAVTTPATSALDAPASEPVRVSIPAEYVMQIKGKRHVLYAGLVIGAQRSGLVSLSADWTYNDAELSLAHAVATFADGRRYEDSGDASPSNVTKGIASHFRRVALTRAKARCLRDALGIQECSVEELEEDEGKRETPDMSQGELKQRLWARIQHLAPTVKTKTEVAAWVQERTGVPMEPANFRRILAALGEN